MVRSESPAAFDGEAAGFEEGLESVGELALKFERAGFDFAAAAEGFFQLVEQRLEFGRVPSGGKSVENEDGFASAVGGGTPEEEAFGGVFFRRGRSGCWGTRSFAQRSEIEGREGVRPQFRRGVGGDALFLFPRHG